jgi:CRP/FNR family transcriptional regulator
VNSIESLLKNVPLFQGFEQEDIASVMKLFNERSYQKGSILFLEGELGEEFYFIQSGSVKIYRFDESREVTLALLRKGDYFGEMAVMKKGVARSATAEAIETSKIHVIRRADFIKFLKDNPEVCFNLLDATMDRLRKANDQIYDLTFLDLRSRILKLIKRLSDSYGVQISGHTTIPVKLTHQEMANMVGAKRESFSKVMNELQNQHILKIENKMLIILKPEEIVS